MAIFGLGSQYSARFDKFPEFYKRRCACIGWSEAEAPPVHAILKHLRTGDIVFIKSFTPNVGLTIKAVGVVTEGKVRPYKGLGSGVPVGWVWTGQKRMGKVEDHWPARTVTIYEEFNPDVQTAVLNLLLDRVAGESS